MKSPPASVEEYEFSYSTKTGKMRFRLGEDEWVVDRLAGTWEPTYPDSERGRLHFRCQLVIKDGVAYIYKPDDVDFDVLPSELAKESHWRLCYNRAGNDWRLRDERTGELTFVKEYRGAMEVNWFDGGSHIFCDMPVYVDNEHVAHFGVVHAS